MERKRLNSVSDRKVLANRANALRSTGPVTAAGKAIVARNPIQHGLTSQAIVVRGETAEEWDAHRDAVVRDLTPVGYVEEELAQQVALNLWRLRRVARYEAEATRIAGENSVQIAFGNGFMQGVCSPEQIERLAVLPETPRMVKAMRAEAHYSRCLARALQQLNESRQARASDVKTLSALLSAIARLMENYQANPAAKSVQGTVRPAAERRRLRLPAVP